MKIYTGARTFGRVTVLVNDQPLPLRLELRNHSHRFEWGYAGAGPSQLALALLADRLVLDDALALHWYQPFKLRVVASLPRLEWRLTGGQIDDVLAALEAEGRAWT